MINIEEKLQKVGQLRNEQKEIQRKFMAEYLRIRNNRRYKGMVTNDIELLTRLTDFNKELKKMEHAAIIRCKEQQDRIKTHVDAHRELISNYSMVVEFSFWGHAMAEGGNRFYSIISPEIIAKVDCLDGFEIANGKSEMQRYISTSQLEIKGECWLYRVLRERAGLTPLALLSIKGMGCDVKIDYESKISYSTDKWEKH